VTFFFHMIPALTGTSTRFPVGAPLVDSPEAPVLAAITGIMFLVFLAGATLQVRELRAHGKRSSAAFAAKTRA
jgi:Kef-type K+ transport system membrane component KefB